MKKEEETFAIRTYDKAELASLYCPGREPGAALQNLYRWIRRIPRLTEELNAAQGEAKKEIAKAEQK